MVPTLPARRNFDIRARHKGLGGGSGCFLPHTARVGRTFEALALFFVTNAVWLLPLSRYDATAIQPKEK
jgi:hypothetical protein